MYVLLSLFFFFKQKTAYEMRISDWSSDVCSSDLAGRRRSKGGTAPARAGRADRHHLPQQPPLRDGSGRGGGRLCRLRRLFSDDDQGGRAPRRPRHPDLVAGIVRTALRRDRREHAGESRVARRCGRGFSRGVGGRLGTPGGGLGERRGGKEWVRLGRSQW